MSMRQFRQNWLSEVSTLLKYKIKFYPYFPHFLTNLDSIW